MAKTNGGRVHPKRAEIVRKRADLRPLQRQAVRLIVEEPGVELAEIARRLRIDRSVVSRWVHHDETFKQALEEARSAPKEKLLAEEVLNRMDFEEKEKLLAALRRETGAESKGVPELVRLRARALQKNLDPGEERDIVAELFDLLAVLGTRWHKFRSEGPVDVARGMLANWREDLDLALVARTLDPASYPPEDEELLEASLAEQYRELAELESEVSGNGDHGEEEAGDDGEQDAEEG